MHSGSRIKCGRKRESAILSPRETNLHPMSLPGSREPARVQKRVPQFSSCPNTCPVVAYGECFGGFAAIARVRSDDPVSPMLFANTRGMGCTVLYFVRSVDITSVDIPDSSLFAPDLFSVKLNRPHAALRFHPLKRFAPESFAGFLLFSRSHLRSGIWLFAVIVPTVTVNCSPQPAHFTGPCYQWPLASLFSRSCLNCRQGVFTVPRSPGDARILFIFSRN